MKFRDYPAADKDRQINRAILDGDLRGEKVLAEKYLEQIKKEVKRNNLYYDLIERGIFTQMDADDLAMKIWEVFIKKLKREWINIGDLRRYYCSLVYNVILGYYRKANRRYNKEVLNFDNTIITNKGDVIIKEFPDYKPKKELEEDDKYAILLLQFGHKFKPKYFMALCLKYVEDMGQNEVADLFGHTEGWVSHIVHKKFLKHIPGFIVRSNLTEEELIEDGLQTLLRHYSRSD